ncbi:hypothetical protein BJ741DRAFT_65654 [Chytriomyces cf. hyalinus JEL632]|nr:hypothetical protein BJ741DRAFT_65654 [Chytriomyces cf. hyalinus JEL632]
MPAVRPNQNGVDDELHDLKLRFELLEGDRKAYYETSQWAIRQNKEEISTLRSQNKELSESIARMKKVFPFFSCNDQISRPDLTTS